MTTLIELLSARDLNEALFSNTVQTPASDELTHRLHMVSNDAGSHINDRLEHLETIARMLVIASQDDSVGGFELPDVTTMAFFFEQEMQALQKLNEILVKSNHLIQQAAKQRGTK